MNEKQDAALRAASIGILRGKYLDEDAAAMHGQAVAVYVKSTPIPDDAPEIVNIVESVLRDHALATAMFHTHEAARFKAALIEAEATK